MSLAPDAKHGYAILKDVEALSRGALVLSTSTLYDALERLLGQDLIARVEAGSLPAAARERKSYRLTELGRQVLVAETVRLKGLLAVAAPRLEGSSL